MCFLKALRTSTDVAKSTDVFVRWTHQLPVNDGRPVGVSENDSVSKISEDFVSPLCYTDTRSKSARPTLIKTYQNGTANNRQKSLGKRCKGT